MNTLRLATFTLALIIILTLAAILSGCATEPPRTVLGSAPTTVVSVPVIKPCLSAADVPAVPPTAIPPRGSDFEAQAVGVYAEVETLRALNDTQNKLLRQCAEASSPKEN